MASRLAVRTSPTAFRTSLGLSFASRRCVSTSLRANNNLLKSKRTSLQSAALQHAFRRNYTDAPTANLSPTPTPKKRFRIFRWAWRLTWVSAVGFVGWLSYTVWELRNPDDQFEPDPSKKTLVILGEPACHPKLCMLLLIIVRNWLGCGLPVEETRHRELQRYRRLSSKLFPVYTSPAIMHYWYN